MVGQEYIDQVREIYGQDVNISPCPFTDRDLEGLEDPRGEMLVYLPARKSPQELCDLLDIKTNINFQNERMIRNVMVNENQWFITSVNNVPEFLNKSGRHARREYEDRGIYGMDLRRYLAFVGKWKNVFRDLYMDFGHFPDEQYWTFLLAGSYDKSGTSIVGFDKNGVLSHHGWTDDFKKQFVGSRYVILPPRIEINSETENLERAYR